VFACNLATEANSSHSSGGEDVPLGHGDLGRFASEEFHTAGGAASFAAARMQLVASHFFSQGSNQALTLWDFELS
jgi:hypothetical protein